MRAPKILIVAALVAGGLTACSGQGDGPAAAADDPTAAAAQLDLSCEFEAADAGTIGLGRVTVTGSNTTDVTMDQVMVAMTVSGPVGAVDTQAFVTYFLPGEELAVWSPVLAESEPQGELDSCDVTAVSAASFGIEEVLEPEGATCTVTGAGADWKLTADLSGVASLPEADQFVGVVVLVEDRYYEIQEDTLPAGDTELAFTTDVGTEPTCAVRYHRDV